MLTVFNKINELEVLIAVVKPDGIVVTGLFPKDINPTNFDKTEYKIKGFTCFAGQINSFKPGVL